MKVPAGIIVPPRHKKSKLEKHQLNTFQVQPKHTKVSLGKNTGVNFNVETLAQPELVHKNKSTVTRETYLNLLSREGWDKKLQLEAASKYESDTTKIVSVGSNSFLEACMTSFAQHLPLGLSPDHIWTLITYAFAKHVDKHAEELRSNFVAHEGKKTLEVRTPDTFQLSERNNPDTGSTDKEWEAFVFPEFSKQIKTHIGEDTHSLLTGDFSTSTPASTACSEIVLMSAMKNYFDYRMRTACGIPNITLLGTEEDWVALRSRTESLGKLMKEEFSSHWLPLVLPLLDEFVASYRGNVNHGFWQSMVKLRNTGGFSGAHDFVSGWVQILFPYLGNGSLNRRLRPWQEMYFEGPDPADFPKVISSAPVTWDYHGREIKLEFYAGFTAVSQNESDGMLFPEEGWYVTHIPATN